MNEAHPGSDTLAAFVAGKLSPGGCASVEQHLMSCDSCGDALDRLTVHASLLEHLRGQQGPSGDDTVVPTLDGWVRELKERNPFGAVSDDEVLRRGWLGRYQITGKLGAGGMGAVYLAYHPVLRCERALKVLPRGLAENPSVVERFRREARTICRLDHPNIVRAYDTDSVDDLHFLLMEYVPGTDLGRLVKEKGPLPVAVACDYVRQAALGLQHAHENGMVHRDIKPQNLLLHEATGVVKVSDLGLARPGGEDGSLTGPGVLLGTPDYIAPEQTEDAHSVDIRADLYALGCTLYYLLTGQVPYPGGNIREKLLRHHAGRPDPVERLRPDVPPAVAAIVRRLMAPRREQRYQTPAELAAALARLGAVPQPSRPRKKWLAVGAAAAMLACLLIYLIWGRRGTKEEIPEGYRDKNAEAGEEAKLDPDKRTKDEDKPKEPVEREPAPPDLGKPGQAPAVPVDAEKIVELHCLKGHTGAVRCVALSPDGKRLATGSNDTSVRLWDAATGKPVGAPLRKHTSAVTAVVFSPDGKRLASGAGAGYDLFVCLWDPSTGKHVANLKRSQSTSPSQTYALTFSPDGKRLALAGDGPVVWWDVPPGEKQKTAERKWQTGVPSYATSVAFSPDGKLLAAGCHEFKQDVVRVWPVGAEGGSDVLEGIQTNRPLSHEYVRGALAFSGDGKLLARATSDGGFPGTGGSVVVWDVDRKKETYTRRDPYRTPAGTAFALALLPGGHVLVAAAPGPKSDRLGFGREAPDTDEVKLWDTAGKKEVVLRTGHKKRVTFVAFSSDGRLFATASEDQTVKLWKLP